MRRRMSREDLLLIFQRGIIGDTMVVVGMSQYLKRANKYNSFCAFVYPNRLLL